MYHLKRYRSLMWTFEDLGFETENSTIDWEWETWIFHWRKKRKTHLPVNECQPMPYNKRQICYYNRLMMICIGWPVQSIFLKFGHIDWLFCELKGFQSDSSIIGLPLLADLPFLGMNRLTLVHQQTSWSEYIVQ